MSNECKGCIVYSEKRKVCASGIIPHISEIKQCPCLNCIVKIMCKSVCQEFKIYSELSGIRAKELRREKENEKIWESAKDV